MKRSSVDILTVGMPKDSLAEGYFTTYDYADSYQGVFWKNQKLELAAVVKSFFTAAPAWIVWLLELRNLLVKLFGLKTVSRKELRQAILDFKLEEGESFAGAFPVLSLRENEVLTGEKDKHLDFCVSFLVEEDGSCTKITLTTVVKFNSILGRFYFIPVKPMHKVIVKVMLRKMLEELTVGK